MRGKPSRFQPSVINRKKIISNVSVKDIVNVNTNKTIITKRVGARSTPIIRTPTVQQTVTPTPVQQTVTPKTIVPQRTIGARNTPIITRTAQQTQAKPILKVSEPKLTTAGIAAAAPGAAERTSGNKPVSTHLFGGEVKYDEDGRMDLSRIKDMNIIEAGLHGGFVPTEQMVGIGKDVIYGVAAEDQKQVESGLDLLLNPILKPFADPIMKKDGVIKDEWYWPEELKSDWKVLPAFMQKSERKENQSFIEGISSNIGNVAAIIQSDQAAKIRDEEFATSVERFNTSPATQAYYIGSALGEIPYFLIGAGEAKLAGTIAAKTAAGVLRGGVKGTTGIKLVVAAVKVEKASYNLEKAVKIAGDDTLIKLNAISAAKETLTKGYSSNFNMIKKNIDMLDGEQTLLAEKQMKSAKQLGTELKNSFTKEHHDRINKMKESPKKQAEIRNFNKSVRDNLLPRTKQFKNEFLSEVLTQASNSKIEKLAARIQGSPQEVITKIDKKIDKFLNPPYSVKGDKSARDAYVINQKIFMSRIKGKFKAGEYSGILGNLKLNIDLHTNVIQSAIGIAKKRKDIEFLAEAISRTVPENKVFDEIGKEKVLGVINENIDHLKKENNDLDINIKYISEIELKQLTPEQKVINEKTIEELKTKKLTNREAITELEKTKAEGFNDSFLTNISRTKKDGYKVKQYVFSYAAIEEKFPEIAASLKRTITNMAIRPSVNIRQEGKNLIGTIGDGLDRMDYGFTSMSRSQAITSYGIEHVSNVNKLPRLAWRNVGFKGKTKVKVPILKFKEQKTQILTIYQPKNKLQEAGTPFGFVRPIVLISKYTTDADINQMMKNANLEYFSGSPDVVKRLGGDEDGIFKILQYKPIDQKKIEIYKKTLDDNYPITAEQNPLKILIDTDASVYKQSSQHNLIDVLISRAEIEDRPGEVVSLAKEKIRMLEAYEKAIKNKASDEMLPIEKAIIRNSDDEYPMKYSPEILSEVSHSPISNNFSGKRQMMSEFTQKQKIFEIKNKYSDILDSISSDLQQTKKLLDYENVQKIIKSKGSYRVMHQAGTLFSMTKETFLAIEKKERVKNFSNVVQDMKTGKYYFKTPDNIYEILVDINKFDPDKVSYGDSIAQTTMFFPYKQQFITNKKIGTGDEFDVPAGSNKQDNINTYLNKSNEFIQINYPETYEKKLLRLSPDEVTKLKLDGNNVWGIVKIADENIAKIDLNKPTISFDSVSQLTKASKPMSQLMKEEANVVIAKKFSEKSYQIQDKVEAIRNKFIGPRFRIVEMGSRKPDKSLSTSQSETFIASLTHGGYDGKNIGFTNFGMLFNVDPEKHLTQGPIPSGIHAHTMYIGMDPHNLIKEVNIKETQVNPLKPPKDTNYGMMLNKIKNMEPESISRQPLNYKNLDSYALQEFKKTMVNLSRVKGIWGGTGEKFPVLGRESGEMLEIINPNISTYKTMVEDIVDRPDNKYIRNQTRKDRITKSSNFITASDLKLNVSLNQNNLLTRKIAQTKAKLMPYSFDGLGVHDIINEGGIGFIESGKLQNIITRINEKITKKSVSLAPGNPYMIQALKAVLEGIPRHKLPNKNWQRLKDKVEGMGNIATEDSERVLIEYIQKEKNALDSKILSINNKIKSKQNDLFNMKSNTGEDFTSFSKRKNNIRNQIKKMVDEKDDLTKGYDETYEGNTVKHYYSPGYNLIKPFDKSLDDKRLGPKTTNLNFNGMSKDQTIEFFKEKLDRDMNKGGNGKTGSPKKKTRVFNFDSVVQAPTFKDMEEKLKSMYSNDKKLIDEKQTQKQIDASQIDQQMGGVLEIPKKEKKRIDDTNKSRVESTGINVREMIRNNSLNRNKNNVIGFKKQSVMISPFTTSIINTVRPKQNNQNQLFPSVYAQEQINTKQESTNVIDQFITDVQNTMTGITKGNTRIGDTSIGQGVKTYQPDSSLNIFGSAYAEINKQLQSPTSTIGQLEKINTKDTSGYVMVPQKPISDLESKTKINAVLRENYNIGLESDEKLKETDLNKYQFRHVYRFTQKIDTPPNTKRIIPPPPPPPPPGITPPRIVPPPFFPVLNMPGGSNVARRQNDTPKRKKKKTWWQTPENWYDPYYWGGKNQEGTGYITFTGKEPSKVKKYEKKFFGGI